MSRSFRILPIILFAIGVSLSFVLWQALRSQQEVALRAAINDEANALARAAQTVMTDRFNSLRRMAARWEVSGAMRQVIWQSDARMLLSDLPGTQAMEWADPEGVIRWVEPMAGNERALGLNLNTNGMRRQKVEQAKQTGKSTATSVLTLKQGGKGFLLFTPLFPQGRYEGMLVTVFRAGDFVPKLFSPAASSNLHIRVTEGRETVFESPRKEDIPGLEAQAPIRFWGLEWVLHVSPSAAFAAQKRTILPDAALGVSLVLSLLLAWLVRMNQLAREAAEGMRSANAALRESLAQVESTNAELAFRQFAVDQSAIVGITDVQGHILYANDRFCQISGYSSEELLGQDHRIVNSGYHPPAFFREMYRTIGQGRVWHGIVRNRTKQGTYYWVDATIVPSVGRDGKVDRYIAIRFDVTEQKHVEEALRRVTTLQAAILDSAGYAIIATDAKGVITTFNRAAERILGYGAQEMIGCETVTCLCDPAERPARAAQLARLLGTAPSPELQPDTDSAMPEGVDESEWICVRKDGNRFPMLTSISVLHNADGSVAGVLGIGADISERKLAEAELRRHRDHLQELVREQTADILAAKENAERANQAKSEFLANMSHELRTPMHAILSFSRLGRDRAASLLPDRLRDYFDRICTSGERLLAMINDLLDLSKLEAGKMHMERVPVDMRRLCEDVLADFEQMMAAKSLTAEISPGHCDTRAVVDPHRMAQVVRNLLSNAVKFTPEGRAIKLTFGESEITVPELGTVQALCLTVADEGIGIPEDELDAVFDKFIQSSKTRNGSGGTGLGLAICRDIVEAHHGCIRASNAPGGGALLSVLLPRAADFSI